MFQLLKKKTISIEVREMKRNKLYHDLSMWKGASPEIFYNAKTLRINPTIAENLIWEELKSNKFNRLKFRRQHPISHYIVDFYCHELQLAIEVDGNSHDSKFEEDLKRQNELEKHGVVFIRFTDLEIKKEIHFPHSLGLLYSAFTYYIGFKVNSGEYKLMGLAPYGNPIYKDKILENLVDVKEDGTFKLNQKYFNYATGLTMTNKNFDDLFGQPVIKDLVLISKSISLFVPGIVKDVLSKLKDKYSPS